MPDVYRVWEADERGERMLQVWIEGHAFSDRIAVNEMRVRSDVPPAGYCVTHIPCGGSLFAHPMRSMCDAIALALVRAERIPGAIREGFASEDPNEVVDSIAPEIHRWLEACNAFRRLVDPPFEYMDPALVLGSSVDILRGPV